MLHELLRNARAIQAERGHTKGQLWDDEGRVCIYQAILLAAGSSSDAHRLVIRAARVLGFNSTGEMVMWNNKPERTLEDVLECCDQGVEATAPEPTAPTLTTPELALA